LSIGQAVLSQDHVSVSRREYDRVAQELRDSHRRRYRTFILDAPSDREELDHINLASHERWRRSGMTELLQDGTLKPNASRRVRRGLARGPPDYGQLEARSNQLAGLLRDTGCKKGDRVCLLMPKSPTALVGLLGI